MVRHGATPQQVRQFLAFWKAVLRMSSTTHSPQLKNEVEWFQAGHTLVAVDHLYPIRCFPIVGEWHLRPRESSLVPPKLQLHLWHYICGVSVYVPEKRLAQ